MRQSHPLARIEIAQEGLPGELEVDEDLLDTVIPEINALYVRQGLQMVEAIGELLLDRLFDGDLEAFHTRGSRHQSLRALAQRSDLQLSYSQIWNCLAVLGQLRVLPRELGRALSMHHHKALLPVKDPDIKRSLAEKAVREELSYRALREEVKRACTATDAPKSGRPALPTWFKGLKRVRDALQEASSAKVGPKDFDRIDAREARALVHDIDAQITALQRLKNEVLAGAVDREHTPWDR